LKNDIRKTAVKNDIRKTEIKNDIRKTEIKNDIRKTELLKNGIYKTDAYPCLILIFLLILFVSTILKLLYLCFFISTV